jgi:hypothetical protein
VREEVPRSLERRYLQEATRSYWRALGRFHSAWSVLLQTIAAVHFGHFGHSREAWPPRHEAADLTSCVVTLRRHGPRRLCLRERSCARSVRLPLRKAPRSPTRPIPDVAGARTARSALPSDASSRACRRRLSVSHYVCLWAPGSPSVGAH